MFEVSDFFKGALKTALIVGLTGLLVSYFQKNAFDSKAIRQQGIRVLKFPLIIKFMVAGGLAMFVFIPAATIVSEGYNHVALFFVIFIGWFGYVFYQVFLCSVYWDRSGVYWRSVFGGKRCIMWNEVPSFGGSSTINSPYIQGNSVRIYYSDYHDGAKQLEKMVARVRRLKN